MYQGKVSSEPPPSSLPHTFAHRLYLRFQDSFFFNFIFFYNTKGVTFWELSLQCCRSFSVSVLCLH